MRSGWVLLFVMLLCLPAFPVGAQQPLCELPSGFLEAVEADFERYGGLVESLDVEDPGALAVAFLELSEVRERYEDAAPDLPDCALRIHVFLTSLFSTMQDTVGLALAVHADPDATTDYIRAINARNTRLERLASILENELQRLERPVLQVRYISVEMVNVRAGPGPEHEVLGRLRQGARLDVITLDLDSSSNVWHEFYFEDGTGWVLGELSTLAPP